MRRALLVLLGLLVAAPPAAARSRKGQRAYTVRPGDSCWRIAERVFGDGRRYTLVHQYNDLGPMPHLLKPGQVIWLPGAAGGPLAKVEWLRRDVRSRPYRAVDWERARQNQSLFKLHRVATGEGSGAGIGFVDASTLRMRQDALLVIYGGASSLAQLKGQVKTTVVLEKGTIRGGLARLDREAGLEVRTPSSQVTLQSTLSQIEVDRLKTSIVSVYEGLARVAAQGAKVLVPRDHGTWVKRGQRPAPPVRLPAAPRWDAATATGVVTVPEGFTGGFEARWRPETRAHRYRVEVARDLKFTRIMVDAEVGAGITRFQTRDLALGRYYARVAVIDRNRLEGRPSAVLTMDVVRLRSSRRLQRGADGVYEAVGLLVLRPPTDRAGALEASVDGAPFAPASTPVRLVQPGVHRVRYRLRGQATVSELAVRLLRVSATLTLPQRPVAPGAATIPATLALTDERGRPAALPELVLRSAFASAPLVAQGPGRFTAALPAPRPWPSGDLPVAAQWAGGVLAEGTVPLERVAPPPEPPVVIRRPAPTPPYRWEPMPPALEWARGGPGQPALRARPQSHLGLTTFVAESGEPGRPLYIRSALQAGLSLMDHRLGLELDLPWFDAPANEERTGRHDLGDLRLAVLGVAWAGHGLVLSPALRLVVPSGGFPRDRRGTALEPALLLEWRWREQLTLGTHQAFVGDFARDQATALQYASSYRAAWRPIRWVSLGAELGLVVGLRGPGLLGSARALTAGGVLHLHLGRFRLGLVGGGALNGDARRLLGRFTAGLTLDLGFRGL